VAVDADGAEHKVTEVARFKNLGAEVREGAEDVV
jgi:hypothetical protein